MPTWNHNITCERCGKNAVITDDKPYVVHRVCEDCQLEDRYASYVQTAERIIYPDGMPDITWVTEDQEPVPSD